ncbi:MAG TPA: cytochrome c biogenesis protein [Burkholderiaceae bacterium]|nr:cytochrome c biogenesis protein [Burkholderiaceae bacterium]
MNRAMAESTGRGAPAASPGPAPRPLPLGARCDAWAARVLPWCVATCALSLTGGLVLALVAAPQDFLHGDAYRIVFAHAPASASSVALYVALVASAMAVVALSGELPAMMARAIAPVGALMAFLSLWTGAMGARAMRGLWLEWDARNLAEGVMLTVCITATALYMLLDAPRRADRAAAWLVLASVPVLALPVVLDRLWRVGPAPHAGVAPPPPADASVVWALALMHLAFLTWSLASVLHRLRTVLIERALGAAAVRDAAPSGRG